ncbi:unnamed protein product [Urochloa humidicola]
MVSAVVPSLRPSAVACQACAPASKAQFSVFFSALYMTSMDTGSVKSALLPFGAEQYDEGDARKKSFLGAGSSRPSTWASSLPEVPVAYPAISELLSTCVSGGLAVYLLSSTKQRDELVIAINLRNKNLRGATNLDAQKSKSTAGAREEQEEEEGIIVYSLWAEVMQYSFVSSSV